MDLFRFHFPNNERSFFMDSTLELAKLFRHMANHVPHHLHWRENRPYIIMDRAEFIESDELLSMGKLKITGYVRGRTLNANQLVYFQDVGQFQIEKIISAIDTRRDPTEPFNHNGQDIVVDEELLSVPDLSQVDESWWIL
jgi:hypothetical protein